MKNLKTSLGRKVALCIGATFAFMLVILFFTSKHIMLAGFSRLEEQDVETNITRFENGIERELDNLATTCGDWAPWDDARDFITGKDPDFAKTDLMVETLSNLKINFMMFVDVHGKLYHLSTIDYVNKTESAPLEEMTKLILSTKELIDLKDPNESKTGLLILSDFATLVAAQPISNNLSQKPACGTLIIGRYLDSSVLDNLRKQTCLDIQLTKKRNQIIKDGKHILQILNKDTISGYTNLYNIGRDKHLTFQINMPRKIYNYGKGLVTYFIVIICLAAITILTALLLTLRKTIFKPLNALTLHINEVDKDFNITTKIYTDRNDEIGSLARSFELVLTHLRNHIKELADKQNTTNNLNHELIKTTEKLQEANTELKSFVYVASHDLREPLRKIIVFAEMLKNSLADKIQGSDVENLHYMVDGAERMRKMIEGLLVYSRVSSQPHPLQKVDLNEIIDQICQFELGVLIKEKNASIRKLQHLPTIVADSSQMIQLMQNLIANGIKYQKKDNKPQITISYRHAPDGMVRIEVTDNGIGIKPEYHSAVFTMFKRLHNKEYEGTGIGLSVCKKIVERHHGKIGVESQPDEGSTFWFTIKEVPAPIPANEPIM
jgi:signal transduction histidine kinase